MKKKFTYFLAREMIKNAGSGTMPSDRGVIFVTRPVARGRNLSTVPRVATAFVPTGGGSGRRARFRLGSKLSLNLRDGLVHFQKLVFPARRPHPPNGPWRFRDCTQNPKSRRHLRNRWRRAGNSQGGRR